MEIDSSAGGNTSNHSEISVSANLSAAHIQKMLEDKNKARNYIKSCKNIIKRQSEQLKKQQAEFKNAMSTMETQSFTTRFHSVAFRLELDVMRLINIRRRVDAVFKKKMFLKLASQVLRAKNAEYTKVRAAYGMVKLACDNIVRYVKNKRKIKIKAIFKAILERSIEKNPNSVRGKYEVVRKENKTLRGALQDTLRGGTLDELVEENKRLKEKLKSTELSVGSFIKEMGGLLSSHEPPGFSADSESPKPMQINKGKKGKKPKSRVPIVSPDRIEVQPKKHKTTRVNFD